MSTKVDFVTIVDEQDDSQSALYLDDQFSGLVSGDEAEALSILEDDGLIALEFFEFGPRTWPFRTYLSAQEVGGWPARLPDLLLIAEHETADTEQSGNRPDDLLR